MRGHTSYPSTKESNRIYLSVPGKQVVARRHSDAYSPGFEANLRAILLALLFDTSVVVSVICLKLLPTALMSNTLKEFENFFLHHLSIQD